MPTLTRLREISGTFYDSNGVKANGAKLKIELTKNDYSLVESITVEKVEKIITLDTNGDIPALTKLWSNADGCTGSYYMVTEPDGSIWYFSLAYDASPINIITLRIAGAPMSNTNPVYKYIDGKLGASVSSYASLSAAVTALGANESVLLIDVPTTVAANVTVPANVEVRFINTGRLTVSSTFTVTLRTMPPHPTKRLFYGAGKVLVGGPDNVMSVLNLSWWAGASNANDITHELNQATESLSIQKAGDLLIPAQSGSWKTTGGRFDRTTSTFSNDGLLIPDGCRLVGQGMSIDGLRGTILELTDSHADAFLVAPENGAFRHVAVENLSLKAPATTGLPLLMTGQYPNSGAGFHGKNVNFIGGEYGFAIIDHNDGNDWEAVQVVLDNPVFSYNGTAGFYCNSINTYVKFNSVLGYVNVNKDLFHVLNAGVFEVDGWDARSSAQVTWNLAAAGDYAVAPNADGARSVLYSNGAHGIIALRGGWDEGFQYTVLDVSDNYEGQLILENSTPQGYIMFKDVSTMVASRGNKYMAGQFRDSTTIGSTTKVLSSGDYVRDRAVHSATPIDGDLGNGSRKMSDFKSASKIIFNHDFVRDNFVIDNGKGMQVIHDNAIFSSIPTTQPCARFGSTRSEKNLLSFELLGADLLPLSPRVAMDVQRNNTGTAAGMWDFLPTQSGYGGLNLAGRMGRKTKVVITSGPTPQLDCKAGDIFEITPAQTMTITAIDMVAGQRITLIVVSNGTDYTVTLDSGSMKTSGPISTGAVAGKLHVLSLEAYGDSYLFQTGFVGNL